MRQILYILLTLCCVHVVQRSNAQQIVKAEYFINQDPGFGQGTSIALPPPSSDMAFNFNIDVSASSSGFNLLFIRVKDSESRWSQTIIRPFYKQVLSDEAPHMAMIEYFINQDPGYGQGIPISVPANSNNISVSFDIDVSAVNDGFNLLFIRSKDTEGRWSQTIIRPFYKQVFSESAPDISNMEYFIDNDPGFGQGVPVSFSGTDQVEAVFDIDVANLTNGFHKLFIRSRDNSGRWSITIQRPFYKQTFSGLPPEIVQAEYYFSTDPGFGQGHSIPIPQPAIHLEDFTAFVSYHDLPVGVHQMFLRVKTANGSWSQISPPQQICRPPIPDFEAATVYDGFETSFVNLSTLTDENTEFFWDVDGDGEIDYTGPNDFIHLYPAVGTYLAKLIVVSQEGCADTLTKEVHVVNCLPPSDAFVDDITDVTATVYWIPANIEMSYAIEYGPAGFIPGTGTLIDNITATDYTIGDLLPLTMYDVYLRSNCTISMMSEWEGPIQFETSSSAGVLPGDANCDEMVNVLDVVTIIGFLLENDPTPFCYDNADYDEDGVVTVLDAVAVIGVLLSGE